MTWSTDKAKVTDGNTTLAGNGRRRTKEGTDELADDRGRAVPANKQLMKIRQIQARLTDAHIVHLV